MSADDFDRIREEQTREYLAHFFGVGAESGLEAKGHTTLTARNQPEFHADAPWRLEPDLDWIPLLIAIRDANLRPPGVGPWLLRRLRIEQELAAGRWRTIRSYPPTRLPGVGPEGAIETSFWVFRTRIPLNLLGDLDLERRGQRARLRVVFDGRFPPGVDADLKPVHRYLEIYLAQEPLPLSRAASGSAPRQWFYGDTHYHSAYTNDIWEFGNPVRDARYAGMAIGLDWLVVTDHSCDLDDRDDWAGSLMRWERLRQELASRSISNHRFRCILGEEITLLKGKRGYLHMLAFGNLRQLIEGEFWSDKDRVIKKVVDSIMEILARQGGYPADAVERLFGRVYSFEEVLLQLPSETLIFAAHPYTSAHPPFIDSTWDEKQLTHTRLTGYEFWNSRTRRQTEMLTDPTNDPFREPEWNDLAKLKKADSSRIEKLEEQVEEKWDPVLQQGVDEWESAAEPPERRPVFVAGSDAHGDFNCSVGVGWDYQRHGWISDNALGRARTAVHLPRHQSARVPPEGRILAALKQGACVVTDGPVIEFFLRWGGHVAYMGEVLTIGSEGQLEVDATVHTTPEFGPAEDVEVVTYMKGSGGGKRIRVTAKVDEIASVALEGTRGYCRIATQTTSRDGERFCCFTNPVWLWNPDGRTIRLRIHVTQQGVLTE